MKKILISCIILLAAVSSSYARDTYKCINYSNNSVSIECIKADTTAVVDINATTEITFSCNFDNPWGSGMTYLWDSEHAGYIDSYVYCPGSNWIGSDVPYHSFTMTDYFSSIYIYFYVTIDPECGGTASLSW